MLTLWTCPTIKLINDCMAVGIRSTTLTQDSIRTPLLFLLLNIQDSIVWILVLHVIFMHLLQLNLQILLEVTALLLYHLKLRLELPRGRSIYLRLHFLFEAVDWLQC